MTANDITVFNLWPPRQSEGARFTGIMRLTPREEDISPYSNVIAPGSRACTSTPQ